MPGDKAMCDNHFSSTEKWSRLAGLDSYPPKVTASMGKKKITKRSKVKAFVNVYNYNHLMTIKYSVDIPLNKTVVNKNVRDPALKCKSRWEAKVKFEE
ncbi:60S ribosomal protein L27 [Cricetulus griseus]|uniref:60S ribosomal protein L27 n=1 Tax=Cricetulus griseus TaxID=10029 RepID=G3GWE0_CRIGR|nr:60S ribosomal protein L27 [Cricetulus griseus]